MMVTLNRQPSVASRTMKHIRVKALVQETIFPKNCHVMSGSSMGGPGDRAEMVCANREQE